VEHRQSRSKEPEPTAQARANSQLALWLRWLSADHLGGLSRVATQRPDTDDLLHSYQT